MSADLATLLVSCPDKKGIVASLAQTLYGHGANILDADQHTDAVAQLFFQRIRFDLSTLTTDRVALEAGIREVAARFGMAWRLAYGGTPRRVAIFVSRYDHCLYDLLLRHRAGELPCEVAMVVSNHPDLAGAAAQFDVPFHHLPVTAATRDAQEAAARALLDDAGVDTVVLARYMQILGPGFVAAMPARIINIHHSFLPAFVGASPYRQAYERGVKLIGATAHYVTADLDQGPIIEQAVVRCSHRDTVEDLARKGRDLEKVVLAAALRWHLEDRVLAYAGKTVVFD
ncbi:MAG: formyltetrahydrofolate deformylase [Kofleriaceae bacterium]|nr:formyltetrahydrofolate deformylase [Kofleriaceae bacterium]MCB9575308.1 formyltetrahydrofolate deformylase [Kofleriaceae bacterium]